MSVFSREKESFSMISRKKKLPKSRLLEACWGIKLRCQALLCMKKANINAEKSYLGAVSNSFFVWPTR